MVSGGVLYIRIVVDEVWKISYSCGADEVIHEKETEFYTVGMSWQDSCSVIQW